jgi:hypothetical protein
MNTPGSEDEVDGCDVAAIWISVKAAMVLATTYSDVSIMLKIEAK